MAEDIKRHRADNNVNQSPVYLLDHWVNTNNLGNRKKSLKDKLLALMNFPAKIMDDYADAKKVKVTALPGFLGKNDYILKTAEADSQYSVSPISPVIQRPQAVKESKWALGFWKQITGLYPKIDNW